MKNYKGKTINLGISDIGNIIISAPIIGNEDYVATLHFTEDGSYKAYLLEKDMQVPEHYRKVMDITSWIKIYDDDGIVFEARCSKIEIYRAGTFGVIIKMCDDYEIIPDNSGEKDIYLSSLRRFICSLIKEHYNGTEDSFKEKVKEICEIFDKNGSEELTEYIMAQYDDRLAWQPM